MKHYFLRTKAVISGTPQGPKVKYQDHCYRCIFWQLWSKLVHSPLHSVMTYIIIGP